MLQRVSRVLSVLAGRRAAARPAALILIAVLLAGAAARPAVAAETRLMRQPNIHGDRIVFVYGGDLWMVGRGGGLATKLTNHIGTEVFPMFSPDGKTVAFTAEYDGNADVFTIPATGGEPTRLTWHPLPDRVASWYPDGRSILFRSPRASFSYRFDRFCRVPVEGGFAEVLPLPVGGPACFSPDGRKIAYDSPSMEQRTWKRYQGGSAPEILVYDFDRNSTEKITDWKGTDEFPMWYGNTIYFDSDRDDKLNIWAYDVNTKATRQVTKFNEYDVKWPSLGPDAIVFENGGWLYVMDLPSEKVTKLSVEVPADRVLTRAELQNVSHYVSGAGVSPSAKRVAVEARGDIFTVPAKKGTWRNLTNSPGVRERGPAWSPDGRWVAYWSDRGGEYQICLRPQDGKGEERQLTRLSSGYGFQLVWSPDSKSLLYSDQTGTLYLVGVKGGGLTRIDKSDMGDLNEYGWSTDSKWVVYSKAADNYYSVPWLYSVKDGKSTAIGDGLTDDQNPVVSADGKYLFFRSNRHFAPQLGAFDNAYIFPDATGLYLYTLAADTESPLKVQSDEETPAPEKKDEEKKGGEDKGGKAEKGKGEEGKEGEGDKAADAKIDLAGLTGRLVKLPVSPGNYFGLAAGKGKLFYLSVDAGPIGGGDDDEDGPPRGATLKFFDLEEREEKTVMSGVNGFELSGDGSKILVALGGGGLALIDPAPGQKAEDKLPVDDLQAVVDPKAEWKQMFDEAWRLERDFFYDPNMHGVDWKEMHDRYGQLVPYAAHRSDLNYLLGELIAELDCSHAYVGGGEYPRVPRVGVGLLGADYELDAASGRYRFSKIFRESEWNQDVTAPLGAPGVNVKEGDYLLRVNGQDLKAPTDVFAVFQGTAGRPISILVNSKPDTAGAKEYLVDPVGNEGDLRYTDWVSGNRKKVAEATGGRVAYIHVPDTAVRGQVEFSKGFYSQIDREGLILDGRFNSGGWIPDVLVQTLARKPLSWWARREYKSFRTPNQALAGPKVCLTNEYAGSGGDAVPYYFREWGLGPLVGKRTWGGLVGISRNLPLVDGGGVTIPDFGFYNVKGQWDVENHGVDMDVEVEQWPHLMVEGKDPQLEKAIEIINQQLREKPPQKPAPPKYPVKAGR